jgi:hypothetical protein
MIIYYLEGMLLQDIIQDRPVSSSVQIHLSLDEIINLISETLFLLPVSVKRQDLDLVSILVPRPIPSISMEHSVSVDDLLSQDLSLPLMQVASHLGRLQQKSVPQHEQEQEISVMVIML